MLGQEGLGETRAACTQQEVFSCHRGQRATSLAGPCRVRLGMCPVMSRKGKEGHSVFTKAAVGCASPSPWHQHQRAILSPAAAPREDRLLQRNPTAGPSSPAMCPKDMGCLREPRHKDNWQHKGDDTGHFCPPDSSAVRLHAAGCQSLRCHIYFVDRCQISDAFTVLAPREMLPSCAYPGGRRGTGRHAGRRTGGCRAADSNCCRQLEQPRPAGCRAALGLAPGTPLAASTPPPACGAAAGSGRAASPGTGIARAWTHPAPHSMGWSLLQLQLPHPTTLWVQPMDPSKPRLPSTCAGRIGHDGAKRVMGTSPVAGTS